jgi:hypothetical protein
MAERSEGGPGWTAKPDGPPFIESLIIEEVKQLIKRQRRPKGGASNTGRYET